MVFEGGGGGRGRGAVQGVLLAGLGWAGLGSVNKIFTEAHDINGRSRQLIIIILGKTLSEKRFKIWIVQNIFKQAILSTVNFSFTKNSVNIEGW